MIRKFEELNYYELLQVPFNASSFEVRQAYKSILSIYEDGSLATYSLFSDDERTSILQRIEKAFLTLMDDKKRDEYDRRLVRRGDLSEDMLANTERQKAIPIFQISRAKTKSNSLERIREKIQETGTQATLADLNVAEVSSGKDLKRLRESLGIELEEIFQATKISPTILGAIEADDLSNLPPKVYLKSFLKAYAEVLQLDAGKVVTNYLNNIGKDNKE
jgi:DnaJ-class molecular chaperone